MSLSGFLLGCDRLSTASAYIKDGESSRFITAERSQTLPYMSCQQPYETVDNANIKIFFFSCKFLGVFFTKILLCANTDFASLKVKSEK